MKKIVLDIKRPIKEHVEIIETFDVSTVYEAQGKKGLVSDELHSILPGKRIAGPVVTVVCKSGDNLMIHAAIEAVKPGDIVYITTDEKESRYGMLGELIITALMKRGVKGVITESGIRDVKQIQDMNFPIWTKYITPKGTTKKYGGSVNVPIEKNDVVINPGDILIADDDGVVVIPRLSAEESIEKTKVRMAKEVGTLEKINSLQLSLDFYSLREVLETEGVVYEKVPEESYD
ncbi:4-carboxy-4-hydroxy-2-oxoadipate aldolase/oxaloacetate decarboxylase [Psychrobacillus sp. NPDC096389]|uniref:4-carboxy-4-hydroxy-2-oxoadipate aldolase/oxaloacetate decarboxylase n=1 Tax=Psychrobacillus sp. NPDC096389 TaxID=3364490 RepID=UPI0037FE09DF